MVRLANQLATDLPYPLAPQSNDLASLDWFSLDQVRGMQRQGLFSLVRLLVRDYSGPLFRVRRASDNATLDIGTTGPYAGFCDVASLAAFCGASDGFVERIWEQGFGASGFANAPTNGQQPKIYTGATQTVITQNGVPCMLFDGSNDWMAWINGLTPGSSPGLSYSFAARSVTSVDRTPVAVGGLALSGGNWLTFFRTTATRALVNYSGGAGNSRELTLPTSTFRGAERVHEHQAAERAHDTACATAELRGLRAGCRHRLAGVRLE